MYHILLNQLNILSQAPDMKGMFKLKIWFLVAVQQKLLFYFIAFKSVFPEMQNLVSHKNWINNKSKNDWSNS